MKESNESTKESKKKVKPKHLFIKLRETYALENIQFISKFDTKKIRRILYVIGSNPIKTRKAWFFRLLELIHQQEMHAEC